MAPALHPVNQAIIPRVSRERPRTPVNSNGRPRNSRRSFSLAMDRLKWETLFKRGESGRKSKFTESRIMAVQAKGEARMPMAEVCVQARDRQRQLLPVEG